MSNIFAAFKIATNIGKIKAAIDTVYIVLDKALAVIQIVSKQTDNTKLGNIIKQYVPGVESTLIKLKDLILKYGPIIGFVPPVSAQSTDDPKLELTNALNALDDLLK